jgi:hypothetical protein
MGRARGDAILRAVDGGVDSPTAATSAEELLELVGAEYRVPDA